MNIQRFRSLLEIHGADFSRWPPDLRREAEALVVDTDEGRQAWRKACALDAALDRAAPVVSDDQVARVLGGIAAEIDRRTAPLPVSVPISYDADPRPARAVAVPLWPTAGLFLFLGVAGFLLGQVGLLAGPAEATPVLSHTLLSSSPYTVLGR